MPFHVRTSKKVLTVIFLTVITSKEFANQNFPPELSELSKLPSDSEVKLDFLLEFSLEFSGVEVFLT